MVAVALATVATLLVMAFAAAATAQVIPNTGSGPAGTHDFEGYGHVEAGSPAVRADRLLTAPFDPEDADPVEAAAAGALWSPGTPENDLAAALDAMAGAATAEEADAARSLAIDILEGNPIARKAYSGIPLLNWDTPAKVKDVASGGTVEINQVRWGEHVISDTWLLRFENPSVPFRIKYRIAELGSAAGGQLNPTPLLQDGATRIGQHSAVQPLGIRENLNTGTHQKSRFTTDRGLPAVPEQTRNAVQEITVAMPPSGMVSAVLDPNLRAGHESATALMPATAERIAAARSALDFQEEIVAGEPSAADKERAIARLAATSPERQVYDALEALPSATTDPAAFLAAAKAAGSRQGVRDFVGAMRSRSLLPAGVAPDPAADATIVLQNNEAYLAKRALRLAPGAKLKVEVINRDGFAHRMSGFDLFDRDRIFGAEDWGAFKWGDSDLGATSPVVAAGGATTFEITPASTAFALWLGDLSSGDQAHAVIALDRSVKKQEALKFGAGTRPIHSAADPQGNVWVTLAGVDTIARIAPAGNLAESKVEKFPIPGGKHAVDSAVAPLAPADITVDGRGIVWATLSSGNAIARIDPAAVSDGTGNGITKLALDACRVEVRCQPEIPPVPNEVPTRRPTRVKSMIDGQGHTVLWFAEAGASNIGVLRVDQNGQQVNQAHFPCGCVSPESLDLGPDGSVWYTQIFENRIGRVRPDPSRPYSESAVQIDHYKIPRSVPTPDPLGPNGLINTSLPLSIAVDGRNRVWFSESALGTVAWLDPERAVPNTSQGITELPDQPGTDFRSPAAPADVMVDRANNFWWAGEYGDQIEQVKPDSTGGMRFRGSTRRGLTEGPVSDTRGNLWVVETGGNLITRISDVTAGKLVGDGLPAGYEADTTQDTLEGVRVRDAVTVDVKVQRAGAIIASASADVVDGAFTIADGAWQGTSDAVRADDVVRIQRHHPDLARAELSFRVADLGVAVQADGSLLGHAKSQGGALADRVAVAIAGGATHTSGIDGANGAFRITPPSPVAATASGAVSWSGATVAGSFRTVTRFAPPAAPDPGPGPGPGAGDGSGGGQGGSSGDPVTPAPTDAGAGQQQPGPGPGRIEEPSQREQTPLPDGCGRRAWLYFVNRKATALLLGMSRAEVGRCVDLTGRGLRVRYRGGRVVGFTLSDRRLTTSRGAAGVGSHISLLRRQVPGLRAARPRGTWRAVLTRMEGGRTEIRVSLDRRGRATQIVVTLK